MTESKIREFLTKEGYREITFIEGKGICALFPFIFTIGLCVDITQFGYDHRYCYAPEHAIHALVTLKTWEAMSETLIKEVKDPDDPFWIKKKGSEEYNNPKKLENV